MKNKLKNPLLTGYNRVKKLEESWEPEEILQYFTTQRDLRTKYGYCLVNKKIINELLPYSPFIEVGAGTGYLAWLLSQCGATITAHDICLPSENTWVEAKQSYFPLIISPKPPFENPEKRTLLLCWPPMDNMAEKTLGLYLKNDGKRVVYIGEAGDGCTATRGFWKKINDKMKLIKSIKTPNWKGQWDAIHIFEK